VTSIELAHVSFLVKLETTKQAARLALGQVAGDAEESPRLTRMASTAARRKAAAQDSARRAARG